MNTSPEENLTKILMESREDPSDPEPTKEIDFPVLLSKIFDQEESQQSTQLLIDYLRNHKVKSIYYRSIKELLTAMGTLFESDEFQKDPSLIAQAINLFYEIIYDDDKITHYLIQNGIHKIFFPYFKTVEALNFYKELLILDKAPLNLYLKSDLPKDHDEKQIAYDPICVENGYNTVAHFCIENGAAEQLLSLLGSELQPEALKLIATFGYYFFTFQSFVPVFDSLFRIISEDENVKNQCLALRAISTFVGKSKEALNYFLTPELIQLFVDPPLDSEKTLKALVFLAKNIMKRSDYIEDPEILMTIVNFSVELLKIGNESLSGDCIQIISKGTKTGDEFIQLCLDNGIVQQMFALFESGSFSYKVKSQLFITICNFFEGASCQNAVRMAEIGFFTLLSEYLDSMSVNNENLMTAALDALNNALDLASKYSELDEWKALIFEDTGIIDPIMRYDCGDEWDAYAEDSADVYAHAFLLNYYTYQQAIVLSP